MSAGHFVLPDDVLGMPEDAWGPLESLEVAEPPLLPYQPYSTSDHIGRVSDWSRQQKYGDRYSYGRSAQGEAAQTFAFTYKEEEEDDSFRAVGRTASIAAAQKKRAASSYSAGRSRGSRSGFHSARSNFGSGHGGRGGGRNGFRRGYFVRNWTDTSRLVTDSMITVMPSWEVMKTVPLTSLQKSLFGVPTNSTAKARDLHERDLPPLPKATDMEVCGQLNLLNPRTYQMASCRTPTPVAKSQKLTFSVSTSDDPVMQRLADQIREEGTEKTVIFATDNIVAALMTAPRSVLPWGVSISRKDNLIFLDVTEGSMVNLLSVCENDGSAGMATQDSDSVNSPSNLWREASYVSDMYAQHVVSAATAGPAVSFEKPCPFLTEEDKNEKKEAAPVAYRYRRYALSETVDLVVRCELQAVQNRCTADTIDGNLVEVCALNEWNPSSTAWKKEIDKRVGFVLASELKNNSCRMTRVTAKAFLSGANKVHVGFITRKSSTDNMNHVLLASMLYDTVTFASHLTVTARGLWGIADALFQLIVPLPDGKYLLAKQDSSANLTLYATPEVDE